MGEHDLPSSWVKQSKGQDQCGFPPRAVHTFFSPAVTGERKWFPHWLLKLEKILKGKESVEVISSSKMLQILTG